MITIGEAVALFKSLLESKSLVEWYRSNKKQKGKRRLLEDDLKCVYSDRRDPEGTSKVDAWVTTKLGSIEDRADPRFIELRIALQAFAGARRLEGSPVDGADYTLLLDALYDAVRANGHAPDHEELLDVLNRRHWPSWLTPGDPLRHPDTNC